MKHVINAIVKKLLCCHEWTFLFEHYVKNYDEFGFCDTYSVRHYVCKKCGKYKKIKSF